jgi:hypothetical protein
MADAMQLPVYIPPGSTILSLAPLKWREPNGTESMLQRIYWADDGWRVDILSVSVAADFQISMGTIEVDAAQDTRLSRAKADGGNE